VGEELYLLCRGEDDREVHPNRISKSLSNETTFTENLVSLEQCGRAIRELSLELIAELRLKAPDRKIRKAFVKVKFSDFTRTTRECVCDSPEVDVFESLLSEAYRRKNLPVRLLGTGVRFDMKSDGERNDLQADFWNDFA